MLHSPSQAKGALHSTRAGVRPGEDVWLMETKALGTYPRIFWPKQITKGFKVCEDCNPKVNQGIGGAQTELLMVSPPPLRRHRHPEHVNLRARLCESDGCKLRAVFGEVESRQKRFCFAHKQPDDINVNTKACRHPEVGTQSQSRTGDGWLCCWAGISLY